MAQVKEAIRHSISGDVGPIEILCLGFGLLFLWFSISATLLQVQTSEAFYLHGQPVASLFHANYGLFQQLIGLFTGQLSGLDAQTALYGWGIEFVTLLLSVYEIVNKTLQKHSGRMASLVGLICITLVGLNSWSDFTYGGVGDFWSHAIFALICVFFSVFGPFVGMALIAYAIGKARR